MKIINSESLTALHTHTHTHTSILKTNKKRGVI